MPGQTKISLLGSKSSVDNADQFPIYDSVSGQTKKVSKSVLALSLSNATSGWNNLGYTPTYATNDGSKQSTLTLGGSVDLTALLTPGMRLSITRSVTPPTQCMSYTAASSQYATKASPSGFGFTTQFTCEAWVRLNSYPSGNGGVVGASVPGTSGFLMYISSTGQIVCYTVGTQQISYQSIPLNRWVHIAVTYNAGTMVVYINGAIIPSSKTGSGSSFTQGGALQIGAYNSTNFFDGYISEARIWSVAQSQANIQANMAISLTGSETNLAGLWQGNGNFNDKTSNANHLTATNGPASTQLANPYNAIEYAIITKVAYSAPNTTITVFTGTDCTIPNMAFSSVVYATVRAPYGFPNSRNKWRIDTIHNTDTGAQNMPAYNTPIDLQHKITIPIGEWNLKSEGGITQNNGASAATALRVFVNTSGTTTGAILPARASVGGAISGLDLFWYREVPITISSPTTYGLYLDSEQGGGAVTYRFYGNVIASGDGDSLIAECAYF